MSGLGKSAFSKSGRAKITGKLLLRPQLPAAPKQVVLKRVSQSQGQLLPMISVCGSWGWEGGAPLPQSHSKSSQPPGRVLSFYFSLENPNSNHTRKRNCRLLFGNVEYTIEGGGDNAGLTQTAQKIGHTIFPCLTFKQQPPSYHASVQHDESENVLILSTQ